MGGPTARGPLNSLPPHTKMATPDLRGDFWDVSSSLRTAHTQLPILPRPDPMQIQTGDRVVVEVLQFETLPFWSHFRRAAAEQLPTIHLFRLSTPPRPPLPYRPRPHRHSPPHSMNTQVDTSVCTSITTTTAHRLGTTHCDFSQLCPRYARTYALLTGHKHAHHEALHIHDSPPPALTMSPPYHPHLTGRKSAHAQTGTFTYNPPTRTSTNISHTPTPPDLTDTRTHTPLPSPITTACPLNTQGMDPATPHRLINQLINQMA